MFPVYLCPSLEDFVFELHVTTNLVLFLFLAIFFLNIFQSGSFVNEQLKRKIYKVVPVLALYSSNKAFNLALIITYYMECG